jgi:cytochrome c-type biogenesis protein CcmI
MTEQVVAIAIGTVVAAFVLRPLLRGKGASSRSAKPSTASAGGSDELAELELDREMGRVSETDYRRWRAELERATPVPAAADNTAVVLPDTAVARAEELVRQWRDAPRPTCPNCGVRPEAGARFCSNCGASISG